MTLSIRLFLLSLLLLCPLAGCGMVIGAGAAAGTAAMEERGLSAAIDDTIIQTWRSRWASLSVKIGARG